MIHHEFHHEFSVRFLANRESTIFVYHIFTYPSKILRCSTQKKQRWSKDATRFHQQGSYPAECAAADHRGTGALWRPAKSGSGAAVQDATEMAEEEISGDLAVGWGYVSLFHNLRRLHILYVHSLFMSHTLFDSSLFILFHFYSSLFTFIHLYSSMSHASKPFLPLKIQASAPTGDVCRTFLRSSGVSCCSCNAGGVLCRSAAASGGFSAWGEGEPMEVLMMGKSAINSNPDAPGMVYLPTFGWFLGKMLVNIPWSIWVMIGITIVMIVMMVVINDGCNDCQLQGLRCDRSLESWFIQYIYIYIYIYNMWGIIAIFGLFQVSKLFKFAQQNWRKLRLGNFQSFQQRVFSIIPDDC